MDLYTVLVNWKGSQDTIACATSLLAAEHDGMTIVISENASPDDSIARLIQWADATLTRDDRIARPLPPHARRLIEWVRDEPALPPLRLVLSENDGNLGFAGGNNVGIALALADLSCRHVFILNNDTEVTPDALLALKTKADSDPSLAIIGATLVYHDRPDTVQGLGARYRRNRAQSQTLFADGALTDLPQVAQIEREMEYVIGAAMFVCTEVLRRTKGLSEEYFLYYEELDLAQQLLPDERIGWAPGAVIRHKIGGSIGTGRIKQRPSDTSLYYDHRSKIRFYRTYWPKRTPFLAAGIAKTLLAYLRKGDARAARVIMRAVMDYATKPASYRARL